jgi:hypothetical protein
MTSTIWTPGSVAEGGDPPLMPDQLSALPKSDATPLHAGEDACVF